MLIHNTTSVLFVTEKEHSSLNPLILYLSSIPHMKLNTLPCLPDNLDPWQVVVTVGASALSNLSDRLSRFVDAGGGWLNLVELSDQPLADLFGVQPGPVGPAAELRVMFHNKDHRLGVRLPDAFYLCGRYQPLILSAENTEIVLYGDWQYRHRPVFLQRPYGNGGCRPPSRSVAYGGFHVPFSSQESSHQAASGRRCRRNPTPGTIGFLLSYG